MKCSKCGNELNKEDLFCTKCGKKVELQVEENKKEKTLNNNRDKKQSQKKWKKIVTILIIVLIIIAIGIFVFEKINDGNSRRAQELINNENTQKIIEDEENIIYADNILTVISNEDSETSRGFWNFCSEYGEIVTDYKNYGYKGNDHIFLNYIRVDKEKIESVFNELSNNQRVMKVFKGYYIDPQGKEQAFNSMKKFLEERYQCELDDVNSRIDKITTNLSPINKNMGMMTVLYDKRNIETVRIAYTMVSIDSAFAYQLMSYGSNYNKDSIIIANISVGDGISIYSDDNYGTQALEDHYYTMKYASEEGETEYDWGVLAYIVNQDGSKWEEIK